MWSIAMQLYTAAHSKIFSTREPHSWILCTSFMVDSRQRRTVARVCRFSRRCRGIVQDAYEHLAPCVTVQSLASGCSRYKHMRQRAALTQNARAVRRTAFSFFFPPSFDPPAPGTRFFASACLTSASDLSIQLCSNRDCQLASPLALLRASSYCACVGGGPQNCCMSGPGLTVMSSSSTA